MGTPARRISVDLNSDLGELPESLAGGADFELMRYITSANIACGGHAGDAHTMERTLALAKRLSVAPGAHPAYPDPANFGRIELPLAAGEIEASVRDQILRLSKIAESMGIRLVHVKPHGALYHAANHKPEVASAIGRAVLAIDPNLVMVGQANRPVLEIWRTMGLRCAAEAFADRAYEPDGNLRKRTLPGALLQDPQRAAEQALRLAERHSVIATNGAELPLAAATLCIHSDTPGAVAIAQAVNRRLKAAGISLRPLGRD
jgi:UPF0271 protein